MTTYDVYVFQTDGHWHRRFGATSLEEAIELSKATHWQYQTCIVPRGEKPDRFLMAVESISYK